MWCDGETTVDKLCSGITEYAIKLTRLQISEKEHEYVTRMLQIVSDIERISDYCENIAEAAEELADNKLEFSDIAKEELEEMLNICADAYVYAIDAFVNHDKDMALKVIEEEIKADDLEIKLRSQHIKRLANNDRNTEKGVVFLDTLIWMERISDHARNIAEEVLEHLNL